MFDFSWKSRQKFFANFMSNISKMYSGTLDPEKKLLFEKLKEQKSKIPQYAEKNSIKIVELGAGSGCNLQYYPENCSLFVVDPNPYFEPIFLETLKKHPSINYEGNKVAYGEDMDFIEDESVDAVVVTAVGCSMTDVQQVYKEILRILVPGGKFYYLEHIRGVPGSWPYYKQKLMTVIPVWKFMNCNCHIDRDLDYQVTLAGFSEIDQRVFEMDTKPFIGFHFISPHVTGIATK